MTIDLYTSEKGGKQQLVHDLNFLAARYENKQQVTFKNPSQALLALLAETGPIPGGENGARKKEDKKRKRPAVDMEKLADGLVRLGEEDLLHVVQMIHDNKAPDTYTKNDVERGLSFLRLEASLTQHRGRVSRRSLYIARSARKRPLGVRIQQG